MPAKEPIARPKLAELVQNRLLATIQTEKLRPGDALPSERELMQTYEVGRPSIREAMQSLKRMGLIEINHGERPRVAAPSFEGMVGSMSETMRHVLVNSPATLDHLKEARAAFEMSMDVDFVTDNLLVKGRERYFSGYKNPRCGFFQFPTS